MGWEVPLTGDAADLQMLARSFTSGQFIISERGDSFVLASPEFEDLADAAKIRDRAAQFIVLLNGAARLGLETRMPVGIGGVYLQRPDGKRDAFVFLEPIAATARALPPSLTITRLDGSRETFHPADPVRDWVGLAAADEGVARVLELLAGGVCDWVNLYRIFEVVEADVGGVDNIASRGWASKTAIREFKHTANSPGALGKDARHGKETTQPPRKPMPLTEARTLILGIVNPWLRSKT